MSVDAEDIEHAAPRPWRISAVGTHTGNGGFHLYIVDARGRKIAVIWGPGGQKAYTASLIVTLVNELAGSPAADANIDEIGAALRTTVVP
jgi:hypothetical protein